MLDLAIIIVTNNNSRDLSTCLDSIRRRTGDLQARVVVSDTESRDDSATIARGAGAIVIEGANRGFGAANNRAIEHIRGMARYLLFLNPDTEIVDGSLEELVHRADERPRVGAFAVRQQDEIGRQIFNLDEFPCVKLEWAKAMGIPTRFREPEIYQREAECDWAIGSFLMLRSEALDATGGFDERFFLYYEEIDLCRRLHFAGWKVLYVPIVTVMHRTAGREPDPNRELLRWRSRRLYDQKWLNRRQRITCRLLLMFRWIRVTLISKDPADRALLSARLRGTLGLGGSYAAVARRCAGV